MIGEGHISRAAMEAALILGMVSATTALVASVVGPVVTLNVARRQFNATVISGNRHKWIESLRDQLAELISLLATALVVKSKWKDQWENGRGPLNAEPALLEKFERIVLAESKIRLLINPGDEDQQRLSEMIDAAIRRLRSEDASDAQTAGDIHAIVTQAQAILRHEWGRVKTGT